MKPLKDEFTQTWGFYPPHICNLISLDLATEPWTGTGDLEFIKIMGDKQFKDLPNEVIMVIFTFMDFKEIINCTKGQLISESKKWLNHQNKGTLLC